MAINKEIINHIVESTGATKEVERTNVNVAIAGTDKTVVNYTGLKRYHHQLLSALGLVQDTAEYQYKGTRGRWYVVENDVKKYEGVTKDTPGAQFEYESFEASSISNAIDKIYDLAKNGSLTFGTGKSDDATKTYEFEKHTHDEADSTDTDQNIYYIHANVGDEVVNIALDANDFVKDSVLDSVVLVTLEKDVKGNISYIVDGGTPSTTAPAGFTEVKEGTYFHYTWIINNGEKGNTYKYTTISLKDVYGDIKGDDTYITYDKEKATISANTADVTSKIVDAEEQSVKFKIIPHDGRILVYEQTGDGEYSDEPFDEIEGTFIDKASVKSTLAKNGYDLPDKGWDFPESSDVVAYGCQLIGGKTTWEVDPEAESDTNLATAENLANVASDLQDQIDTLAQGTLTPGEITLSSEIAKSNIDVANNKININIAVASETDINALFQKC